MIPRALSFIPEYRDYLWGGQRLRPGRLTAEAWVVYENDRIASGPLAGQTLAGATAQYGADLLGQSVLDRRGPRFPLLIKLLDCNQWLSLQVHPNDAQAIQLEGAGQNGKTEAWYILEAAPEARIIAGLKAGTSPEAMAQAIRTGSILDLSQYENVQAGDTVLMQAGTIHALGPGLLVYEVQESSDITYRVFDWNRPQTGSRMLHIDKSLAVANPAASSSPVALPVLQDGEQRSLCQSEYFNLEVLNSQNQALELDTHGQSFHALTVIEGAARFSCGGEQVSLGRFDSLVVPAASGAYRLEPQAGGFRALKSSL
ncbi:MAG: type I phosphomannose isomerase catalytic subunit [Anaerolineales bacterium]